MVKTLVKISLAFMIVGLLATGAFAGPKKLNKAQMDSVTAGGVTKVLAFVCPVIKSSAVGEHNPNAVPLGDTGTYTVGPPTGASGGEIMVPAHATNGNGYGVPGGPQSQPGDTDYTAIWAKQ